MKISERDAQVLLHIVEYAGLIEEAIGRFGNDFNVFKNDRIYRSSVSMFLMQIGEISKVLTDNFKKEYSSIPWSKIIGMRNFFAHEYEHMNIEKIWNSATKSVPELARVCRDILAENGFSIPDEY